MAKKTTSKGIVINMQLLSAIAAANVASQPYYVNQAESLPLLQANPQLIDINMTMIDPNDVSKVAARVTEAGAKMVAEANATAAKANEPKKERVDNSDQFAILNGAVLPPSRKGNFGGGAPIKYPFERMEIGQSFFVPVSEKLPDPVKTLGSTVSSANMRYAKETGQTKQVERVKRGTDRKGMVDAAGNKIKETVTVPVYSFERKFSLRGVEAGKTYGNWVAPSDGALIARVALDAE